MYNEIFTRTQDQDMSLSIEDTHTNVDVDMLSAEESEDEQIMSFPVMNIWTKMKRDRRMLAKYCDNKAAQMLAKWLTSLEHNIRTIIDGYATSVPP